MRDINKIVFCFTFLLVARAMYPPATALWIFLSGLALVFVLSRREADRFLVVLAVGTYVLQGTVTVGAFYISVWGLPVLPDLQMGRGLWKFALDASAAHDFGVSFAQSLKSGAPFVQSGSGVHLDYFVILGLLYRLLGSELLHAVLLNSWFRGLAVVLAYRIARHLGPTAGARMAAFLVGVWPSLFLWGSQLLKDSLAHWLILSTIYSLLVVYSPNTVTKLWLGLPTLALQVFLLASLRAHVGWAVLASTVLPLTAAGFRAWSENRRAVLFRPVAATLTVGVALAMSLPFSLVDIVDRLRAPRALLSPTVEWGPPHGVTPEPPGGAPTVERQITPSPGFSAMSERLALLTPGNVLKEIQFRRRGFIEFGGHTLIDDTVRFETWTEVASYVPRALFISFFLPFPSERSSFSSAEIGHAASSSESWPADLASNPNVRRLIRLESLMFYAMFPFMLLGILRLLYRRENAELLVWGFILIAAVSMGMLVANLGTLFRFRLQFLLPLFVVGAVGSFTVGRRLLSGGVRERVARRLERTALLVRTSNPFRRT